MDKIEQLTTTLHGFAAVHYARATGVTLRRAEVRYAPGTYRVEVEPARDVTPDEAHALMQYSQAETDPGRITCTATHGELPYRGSGPIKIDWPALHAATLVVDSERYRTGGYPLGHLGVGDALGGHYFPPSYEEQGLAGAVRVLGAAQQIRQGAWEAIHHAHSAPNGRQLATCGIRTALALDRLFRVLEAIGVHRYEPTSQICGVTGYEDSDTVQITGLRWLQGQSVDSADTPPTIREVHAFLAESQP